MPWWVFAFGSAVAAAATAILAKIGVEGVPSNLATAVRTAIVLVFAWAIVLLRGEQQALSRTEALRAASANGAYLTFDEAKKGSLEAGKYADLTVLSADPLTIAEDKIADMTAQMTMVGGRIVHETANWSG